MYGNIAVYLKYCAICLNIDYTLRCLEYISSVSSPWCVCFTCCCNSHSVCFVFFHYNSKSKSSFFPVSSWLRRQQNCTLSILEFGLFFEQTTAFLSFI